MGVRGGLNVVIVLSMTIFSGVSGSKLADVAAIGAVLVPAARRNKQSPADAVALLAASAVMAEMIPPCVNLIIVGYVANVSIGGLFVAGLLPAAFMALALIVFVILPAPRQAARAVVAPRVRASIACSLEQRRRDLRHDRDHFRRVPDGLRDCDRDFGVRRRLCHRRRRPRFSRIHRQILHGPVREQAARAGMVMFIIAMSQAFAFVLTIEQHPPPSRPVDGRPGSQRRGMGFPADFAAGAHRHGGHVGRRRRADHFRPAADAGGRSARLQSAALRAAAHPRHGHRLFRTTARAWASIPPVPSARSRSKRRPSPPSSIWG